MKNNMEFVREEDAFSEKVAHLTAAMERTQPQFNDFSGYYPSGTLRYDARVLENKNERDRSNSHHASGEAADDAYVTAMEALIAYEFGIEQNIPGCKTSAFLASEFDDKMNGTDVVVKVDIGTRKPLILSIDAATGTDRRNIEHKFTESSKPHFHRGQRPEQLFENIPAFCASVKYCKDGDRVWGEPAAPHFVLGLAPNKIDAAYEDIEFENGIPVVRGETGQALADTRFKLVSELYEQVKMYLLACRALGADKKRDANRGGVLKLGRALAASLREMCGPAETEKDKDGFSFRNYDAIQQRMAKGDPKAKRWDGDDVYTNIINVTRSTRATLLEEYRRRSANLGAAGMGGRGYATGSSSSNTIRRVAEG